MFELKLDNARKERLEDVLAFLDGHLEAFNCPMKVQTQLDIAVEEIFVNIAHYAYAPGAGPAEIRLELEEAPRRVSLTFVDRGVPFDPLAKPDPDVTLPAKDRQIGGLGIYMVKKSMDAVTYTRKDGRNILTIRKNLD